MKKIVVLPFLILLLGIVLTACGTAEQSLEEKKTSSSASQTLKETANYVGMADSHTIEVKKSNVTLNFEFTENFNEVLNEFQPGDHVDIFYILNDSGQKEIQEIKKVQKVQ
ncbi:LytA [Bacillus sp. A015]